MKFFIFILGALSLVSCQPKAEQERTAKEDSVTIQNPAEQNNIDEKESVGDIKTMKMNFLGYEEGLSDYRWLHFKDISTGKTVSFLVGEKNWPKIFSFIPGEDFESAKKMNTKYADKVFYVEGELKQFPSDDEKFWVINDLKSEATIGETKTMKMTFSDYQEGDYMTIYFKEITTGEEYSFFAEPPIGVPALMKAGLLISAENEGTIANPQSVNKEYTIQAEYKKMSGIDGEVAGWVIKSIQPAE